jgi:hypothetical protein
VGARYDVFRTSLQVELLGQGHPIQVSLLNTHMPFSVGARPPSLGGGRARLSADAGALVGGRESPPPGGGRRETGLAHACIVRCGIAAAALAPAVDSGRTAASAARLSGGDRPRGGRQRRPGAEYADCIYGTDCADCGPALPASTAHLRRDVQLGFRRRLQRLQPRLGVPPGPGPSTAGGPDLDRTIDVTCGKETVKETVYVHVL